MDNEVIEDDILIENEWRAGFFVTDKELVIEYGEGPRNMILEFFKDTDKPVIEMLLADPNFWVQIMNALSAAIKEKM